MAEWSVREVDACWDAYTVGHGGAGRLGHLRRAGPPRPDQGGGPRARRAGRVVGPHRRGGVVVGHGGRAVLRRAGASRWASSTRPRGCSSASWRAACRSPRPRTPTTSTTWPTGPTTCGPCWPRSASASCRATGPGAARGARRAAAGGDGQPRRRAVGGVDADPGRAGPEPHRPQARGARAPAAAARELERAGRPLLLRPPPPGAGAHRRHRGRGPRRARTPSWSCSARCGRTTAPPWSTRTSSGRRSTSPSGRSWPRCLHSGEIVRGSIHHPILGEQVPVENIPVRFEGRIIARAAARLAGAAQGADQHVRAHLPRRVRAAGRHGGPVGLPLPRRGRRHRGGAAGGRRGRRGRRRRPGGVRLAQRHERVPPHGDLHPARGAALRRPRHRGVGGRVGAGHGAPRGRGGRAPARRHRARALHPAALPRRGDRRHDPAARRHRRAPPRPPAPLQGRRHPRGAPPGQEQPADDLVAAQPAGAPGGGPRRPRRAARGRAPGALDRAGARDPVARPERPGPLRRDRRLAGADGRGLGGVVAARS